jgi:SAM-dependent methyltransferase
VSAPGFWQDLYAHGGDGWELRQPAPALAHYLETTPPPRGRVAVPGCGRGHDVRLLAARGYEAVGFDFSEAAVAEARRLAAAEASGARFELRDLFALPREYTGAFDGVWEYTCFCAIDPVRRAEYVRVMRTILRPGGWLLACFYPIRPGRAGPPFPVRRTEVRRLLGGGFRLERTFAPSVGVPRRLGQEWMVLARATGGPA